MRVLVVEDEKRLAAGLKKGLEAEGFATDVALNGTDGLWMAREHPYDAIVLDIMLPGVNGYRICETLRGEGNWTPILMLTAKDGEWDEVEALDTGADDYLTKPFSYAVLVARLRALLRRGARERPPVLNAGDLRLDPAARRVWQRLGIARALVNNPTVMFLDEPTLGLDPSGRHQVLTTVRDIVARRGATVVLSTHDGSEVDELCTGVLDLGRTSGAATVVP